MKTIQLIETTPEDLASLISASITAQLQDLGRNIGHKPEDELLTREAVCDFLKINSSTLWHWTNKGKVKAYGIANRRYYKKSELIECLKPLKK
jgi:hypothetical protein